MARIDGGWGLTYWWNDDLVGTDGSDEIRANGGNDTVHGDDGRDTIWGGEGHDELHGDRNSDLIFGESGDDKVFGGADHDTISGGSGQDTLDGGTGRDLLNGGWGNDILKGDIGNDVLIDYEGNNRIDGGTDAGGGDIDTLDFSVNDFLGRVNINLSTGTFTTAKFTAVENAPADNPGYFTLLGTSTVVNVEKVIGAILDDSITGSANNEILLGGFGNDTIIAGGGNDTVGGGFGSDSLTGGSGRDVFLFDSLGVSVTNSKNARDIVTDFNPADDTIQLDNDVFTALGSAGPLSADAFRITPGGSAADAEDRLIYNTFTNILFFDPDGTGDAAAIPIAQFENRPLLTVDDFQII